jgi:hypothetical protein
LCGLTYWISPFIESLRFLNQRQNHSSSPSS